MIDTFADTYAGHTPPAEWGAGKDARLAPELVTQINRARTVDEFLDVALQCVARYTDAAAVRLWSFDDTTDPLTLRKAIGIDPPSQDSQEDMPVDWSEVERVATHGTPCLFPCQQPPAQPDVREWAERHAVVSFAAVPLKVGRRVWGVLTLFSRSLIDGSGIDALTHAADLISLGISHFDVRRRESDSSEVLRSLLRWSPSAVITLDRQGNVTRWNRAAERMFDWKEERVLGKPLPIVLDEYRREYDSQWEQLLAGRSTTRVETVCGRADGSRLEVIRTAAPLFDEHGNVVGALEVLADDSDRTHTVRCLRMQSHIMRILNGSRSLDDAAQPLLSAIGGWLGSENAQLWIVDEDRNVLERAAIWSQHVVESTHPEQRRGSAELSQQVWKQQTSLYRSDVVRRISNPSDGVARTHWKSVPPPVAGLGVPIAHEQHTFGVLTCLGPSLDKPDHRQQETLAAVAGAIGQFIDRKRAETALQRAESDLRQSQKMDAVGLLAGGVAHDFNNLLTIILTFSELGLGDVDQSHPLHEMFAEIHDAGQRAAAMTRRLLTFSRQQPAKVVSLDLNRLVEDMDRMLRRLVGPHITLQSRCDDQLEPVQADLSQMEQVLLNLVVNARDAMPQGGRITVSTRNVMLSPAQARKHPDAQPGLYVQLAVEDTGCGMDAATQARIFEPFFTTKAPDCGTGMGLSTVFGIVKHSGGFINVHSEPDVGTAFSIFLPHSRETLEAQSFDEQPETSPVGTETVLVVEADHVVRSLIRRILEVRGYSVIEAAHGGETLAVLSSSAHNVDLVLYDLQLPAADVRALIGNVRSAPGTRLLLMSGKHDPGQGLEMDPQIRFLAKPFTSDTLARQVRSALDAPSDAC